MGLWEVVSMGGLLVFERRRWNKEVHSSGALDGGGGLSLPHVKLKKSHFSLPSKLTFPHVVPKMSPCHMSLKYPMLCHLFVFTYHYRYINFFRYGHVAMSN